MKRNLVLFVGILALFVLSACSNRSLPTDTKPWWYNSDGATMRLVIQGYVTDEKQHPLEGIRIDVYGVREDGEPDIPTYNYAFSDSLGYYAISRYKGREDRDAIVVASDPKQWYVEKTEYMSTVGIESSVTTDEAGYSSVVIWCNFMLTH